MNGPPSRPVLPAVSTVTQAPVTIGNTVRGVAPVVRAIAGGVNVTGRDMALTLAPTVAAITGWTLIGGLPLTPASLLGSVCQNFARMYNKFRIKDVIVHYVTTSATSQPGSVAFYYERDRNGPMIDFSDTSLLPYLMSDPNNILTPQWQNVSMRVTPREGLKFTDYGMTHDLHEEASGSIFVFSKTSSANSPGLVFLDYSIDFLDLALNPRAGLFPLGKAIWQETGIAVAAVAVTTSTAISAGVGGNGLGGVAVLPSGVVVGDIFKCVFDVTNSQIRNTWTNITAANFVDYLASGNLISTTIDDGFTCYAMYSGTSFYFYPSLEAALTNSQPLRYGVAATVTYGMIFWISYVASVNSLLQAQY